jgi:membrane peptidoglycan carboxypeptidase
MFAKNSKDEIEIEEVPLGEFFEDSVTEVTEAPKPIGVGGVFTGLAGVTAVSILIGVIFSIYPIMTASGVAQVANPVAEYWKALPSKLDDVSIAQRNTFYDKDGNEFAQTWVEDRIILPSIDKVSKYAKDGLIATEDKRFYDHGGVDVIGTARAALTGSGGGSGITQQLVKNLQFYNTAGQDKKLQSTEHSLSRKIRELKLAIEYESTHTKDQIVLNYFNTVAFGSPTTYSIETASQYFFGKSAATLDLAESAALVGSANNPSLFNLNDPKMESNWKERQATVLDRMTAEGYITADEAAKATAEKLTFVKKQASGNCSSSKYPFYCEYALSYLQNSPKIGETPEERAAVIAKGGLKIKTYLDPKAMAVADARLEKDFGNSNRVVAPVAIVQPGTGGVQAMAVNREYGDGEGSTTINVPNTPAATGSTYKMFTLATAINSGMNERDLAFASQCPLQPAGYDSPPGGFTNSVSCGLQGGYLNYKQATALSSNTWFVTLATKIGMDKVFDMSRQLNLQVPESINNRSLSFVLGPVENSPINMAAAYATFANEGIFCPATPIESYSYTDGSVPAAPDTYNPESDSCKRVMSPYAASTVLKAMRANTYPGEVPGAFGNDARVPGYDVVGKSGTNQTYNFTQGHLGKNYSLFIDVYDMDKLTNGVYGNAAYKGTFGNLHMAGLEASDILKEILADTPNAPLNFDSQDRTFTPVPVEKRNYFTIPSVLGMKPAEALSVMNSLGIPAHVSKETRPPAPNYPSGVIVEQTPEAGMQLPNGTKKEAILYVAK